MKCNCFSIKYEHAIVLYLSKCAYLHQTETWQLIKIPSEIGGDSCKFTELSLIQKEGVTAQTSIMLYSIKNGQRHFEVEFYYKRDIYSLLPTYCMYK